MKPYQERLQEYFQWYAAECDSSISLEEFEELFQFFDTLAFALVQEA